MPVYFFAPNSHFCRSAIKKNNSHKQIKLDIDLSDDVREVFEIDLEKFFRRATLKHNILIPPGGQKLGVKSRFWIRSIFVGIFEKYFSSIPYNFLDFLGMPIEMSLTRSGALALALPYALRAIIWPYARTCRPMRTFSAVRIKWLIDHCMRFICGCQCSKSITQPEPPGLAIRLRCPTIPNA